MKYLSLSADGNIYNLGDCGDWEAANEIAEEYLDVEPVWTTTLKEWTEIANVINKENNR